MTARLCVNLILLQVTALTAPYSYRLWHVWHRPSSALPLGNSPPTSARTLCLRIEPSSCMQSCTVLPSYAPLEHTPPGLEPCTMTSTPAQLPFLPPLSFTCSFPPTTLCKPSHSYAGVPSVAATPTVPQTPILCFLLLRVMHTRQPDKPCLNPSHIQPQQAYHRMPLQPVKQHKSRALCITARVHPYTAGVAQFADSQPNLPAVAASRCRLPAALGPDRVHVDTTGSSPSPCFGRRCRRLGAAAACRAFSSPAFCCRC